MRHGPILLMLVVFTVVFSACATTGAFVPEPVETVPPVPKLTSPEPSPPTPAAADSAELYNQAHDMYIEGVELAQAQKYDEALALNNRLITLLLTPFDRAADDIITKKIDSLFFEVCLAQVRIGRVTGRFAPVPIEENLIGIQFNEEVQRWLSYFTGPGRSGMQRYLARSTRYLPMIRKVLAEEGLPQDLAYLPIIESGFSPYAYSPAAAVGVWQFIPGTGRNYGLKIDDWVDERRDPAKATRAAARYLKDLHQLFNDWALALAAYNCGEGRVGGAIRAAGHQDYWNLGLPAETTAYVPKFFAAVLIARDPELYGMYVTPETPLEVTPIKLGGVAAVKDLATFLNVPYEDFKAMNPELLGTHTPPKVPDYLVNVPTAQLEEINQRLATATVGNPYVAPQAVAKIGKPQTSGGGGFISYRVRKGDTLGKIARKYRTTVKMIQRYNRVNPTRLRIGQTLRIPVGRRR